MKIMCLVTDRKELISAIEALTGEKMKYQGPPSFAYAVGDYTVERDGTLEVVNEATHKEVLSELTEKKLIDNSWNEDREVLCIDAPMACHTGESLTNLVEMLWTKQELINKAIGYSKAFYVNERFIEALEEELPQTTDEFLLLWEKTGSDGMTKGLEFDAERISFIGFPPIKEAGWMKAYADLVGMMNTQAIKVKRIELKKTIIENEKYYFRVWLSRLGFGGNEYKTSRKLLLSKLSGHTAFRTEEQKELHKQKYQGKQTKEVKSDEEP